MPIEKLPEFAKDGQKNTDDLTLLDGFPVGKKPARQWFNWLFNTLTVKINEIIDDFIPKTDIVDNLTTNDASKPVSAKQAKLLQDNKFNKADVVNSLTTGGVAKALSAEQGKALFAMFSNYPSQSGYQKFPNGIILQWGIIQVDANGKASQTLPIAFTTQGYQVVTCYDYPDAPDYPTGVSALLGITAVTVGIKAPIGSGTYNMRYIAIGK